jgi:hypothetical protein
VTRARPTTEQPYPWLVPDLFRWFGLLLLSVAGLVVAWWGTSGTAHLNSQITWLNVGVGAVVVGGLGNMTWLLQGRRALALRRRTLLVQVAATTPLQTDPYPGPDGSRFVVAGTTRYHRAGCPAIAGKPAESMSVARHERAGRRACGLCGG